MDDSHEDGAFGCLVVYPMPDVATYDARAILVEIAARHGGRVSNMEFASLPGKVPVSFDLLEQANAFMEELTLLGRFRMQRGPAVG